MLIVGSLIWVDWRGFRVRAGRGLDENVEGEDEKEEVKRGRDAIEGGGGVFSMATLSSSSSNQLSSSSSKLRGSLRNRLTSNPCIIPLEGTLTLTLI